MKFAITGEDTLTLFDRVINDFADGDNYALNFPTDNVAIKTGKNGNTIFSRNVGGANSEIVIRLLAGSSDDKLFQGKYNASNDNFAATDLADGELVKRLGDGDTNVNRVIYSLKGGMIKRGVDVKENAEGDTEQAVAVYTFVFAQVKRSIG